MSLEDAAKSFQKAMKGFGTDESRIIKEICAHSNSQRQEIKRHYLTMFGHTLEEDLKSEISGNFLDGVLGLLMPHDEYEASCIRGAIKGVGTCEQVIIEILCSKDAPQIEKLNKAYKKVYSRDLQEDLKSEQGGDLGRIFRSLTTATREVSTGRVDQTLAAKEAQELYDAGQGKVGTDESAFVRILCSRSFHQLHATFEAYYENCKDDIEKAIKKEMSGDLKAAFLTIIKSIRNLPGFYAESLHTAMKGMGTNNRDLIRILVSRSEIDLPAIKSEYKRQFGKSLYDAVKSELSGDYEKLFLTLIGKD